MTCIVTHWCKYTSAGHYDHQLTDQCHLYSYVTWHYYSLEAVKLIREPALLIGTSVLKNSSFGLCLLVFVIYSQAKVFIGVGLSNYF